MLDLAADAENLPDLPCIGKFHLRSYSRTWNPRVALVLTSKMPNLTRAEWRLDSSRYIDWGRYYSIDKKYRDSLVQSIQTMQLPSSVTRLYCELKATGCLESSEYHQSLPRFIENGSYDPVSHAIRKLTRHCTEVWLKGSFHPCLFDPLESGPAAEDEPCWQNVKTLQVTMVACCPDGSWLFHPQKLVPQKSLPESLIDCTQLPPGYGDTEEEREQAENFLNTHDNIGDLDRWQLILPYTFIPDDKKVNKMVTAFARCCDRMPVLDMADLSFNVLNDDGLPFQMSYHKTFHDNGNWEADSVDSYGSDDETSCGFYLHFGKWTPTEATITELKNVGTKRNDKPSTIWSYYRDNYTENRSGLIRL